jgi:hypothetical protein
MDPATDRDVDHVPPEELAAAAAHVVDSQGGLAADDLVRQMALLFGYARVGTRVQAAMSAGIALAAAHGVIVDQDGRLGPARPGASTSPTLDVPAADAAKGPL